MDQNQLQPAFPCLPIQDKFGQLIAPIPGWTKFEYAVLQIVCAKESYGSADKDHFLVKNSIALATEFFKQINDLKNEKDTPKISLA